MFPNRLIDARVAFMYSGGRDTTALLPFLLRQFSVRNIILYHYNYRYIDQEDYDSYEILRVAYIWNISIHIAQANKRSTTLISRKEKYNKLYELIKDQDINIVVTGHHFRDYLETVFMRSRHSRTTMLNCFHRIDRNIYNCRSVIFYRPLFFIDMLRFNNRNPDCIVDDPMNHMQTARAVARAHIHAHLHTRRAALSSYCSIIHKLIRIRPKRDGCTIILPLDRSIITSFLRMTMKNISYINQDALTKIFRNSSNIRSISRWLTQRHSQTVHFQPELAYVVRYQRENIFCYNFNNVTNVTISFLSVVQSPINISFRYQKSNLICVIGSYNIQLDEGCICFPIFDSICVIYLYRFDISIVQLEYKKNIYTEYE